MTKSGLRGKGAAVRRRLTAVLALGLMLIITPDLALDVSRSGLPTHDIALAASPHGEFFVVAKPTGLQRSADRGLTWTVVGPDGFVPTAVLAGYTTAPTFYAVGADGTVLQSQDAGLTWSPRPSPSVGGIAALAFGPDHDTLVAATTKGLLVRSTDGGETWQATAASNTSISLRSLAIDPATPTTLYGVSVDGRFYRSLDAGVTWQIGNPSQASSAAARTVVARHGGSEGAAIRFGCGACGGAIAMHMTSLVYVLQGTTLYRSFDEGQSWWPIGTDGPWQVAALAVDPLNEDRLYATVIQGGFIVESLDGGRSWRPLAVDTPYIGEE